MNPGSDNGSVNDEVNQSDPLAILLSQASMGLPEGTEIEVVHHTSIPRRFKGDIRLADLSRVNQNPRHGKRTRNRSPTPVNQNLRHEKRIRTTTARFASSSLGCALDNDYSPPVVNSSILFPIRVTRKKWNCAFGNT